MVIDVTTDQAVLGQYVSTARTGDRLCGAPRSPEEQHRARDRGGVRAYHEVESALEVATAEKDRLTAAIQVEWAKIDKELAIKEDRKQAAVALVDPDLLSVYEDLRSRKEGRVVGRLADGVCGSCHLSLSAAEIASISKDDPPRCIHCRSILVV